MSNNLFQLMPMQDVSFILQYWQILAAILIGAIIEILLREFIINEFISPSLRYKINYIKNKIKKRLGNTSIQLSYSSSSTDIEQYGVGEEKIHELVEFLRKHNIDVNGQRDLYISNFPFSRIVFTGTIEFNNTSTTKGQILKSFLITLNGDVKFNSMNDDIPAIIQAMSNLKEYVSVTLGIPVQYSDNMSCKLTKLIIELSEAMKDLDITFVNFSGEIDGSMYKDKVVFHHPIDPSIIVSQLRKLVVLYT